LAAFTSAPALTSSLRRFHIVHADDPEQRRRAVAARGVRVDLLAQQCADRGRIALLGRVGKPGIGGRLGRAAEEDSDENRRCHSG
jgi:hypothetical protein